MTPRRSWLYVIVYSFLHDFLTIFPHLPTQPIPPAGGYPLHDPFSGFIIYVRFFGKKSHMLYTPSRGWLPSLYWTCGAYIFMESHDPAKRLIYLNTPQRDLSKYTLIFVRAWLLKKSNSKSMGTYTQFLYLFGKIINV